MLSYVSLSVDSKFFIIIKQRKKKKKKS